MGTRGPVGIGVRRGVWAILASALAAGLAVALLQVTGALAGLEQGFARAFGIFDPRPVADRAVWLVTVPVAALAAVLGWWLRGPVLFILVLLAGIVTWTALWYTAYGRGLDLPVAAPILAWLVALGLAARLSQRRRRAERAAVIALFGRHAGPELTEAAWRQRGRLLVDGRPRPQSLVATILYADIAGFGLLADRLAPEDLMNWPDTLVRALAATVRDHQGLVLRIEGDGVLAAFGAPVPRRSEAEVDADAVRAVTCALAMGRELEALNQRWQREGLPAASLRIGLHTGALVAGAVGPAGQADYVLLGDPVALAVQLEAHAKVVGALGGPRPCRILVGDSTWRRLHGAFEGTPVGEVALKGKHRRVAALEILGHAGQDRPESRPVPATPLGRLLIARRRRA